MSTRQITIGLIAFVACLWLVAVTAYAAQIKREGNGIKPVEMQNVSCSSSSSSGEGE